MSVFDIFRALDEKKALGPSGAAGAVEYVICGLGNPGTRYENTRHNTGYMALDTLAGRIGADVKRLKFKSLTADASVGGVRCLLMKPTTYMNLSGEAAAEALRFYKLPPERLVVLYDDISLDVGRIRIREKGSDGGHNGIKSIILQTNSDRFPRVKIGVGAKPRPDFDLASWVLSPFLKEQGPSLEKALENAASAAELIVRGRAAEAMNQFNG